ncbi:hypothetical protein [Streptomyces sp. NPDC059176]|uniref:hypothetical protein n=1 Tax=unclassified Streptomyces TaxID=2593676 RepID=UPI0036A0C91D
MSRNTDLVFTFTQETPVTEVLEALGAYGWVPDDMGGISFLIDPEDGDWQTRPLEGYPDVIAELERGTSAGKICTIMLTWRDTRTGGSFFFYPAGGSMMLSPTLNTRTRRDHPRFLDLEWYLSRLLGPLERIGLSGVETTDLA